MTTERCWYWRDGWRIATVEIGRKWARVTTADRRTRRVLVSALREWTKPLEQKEGTQK